MKYLAAVVFVVLCATCVSSGGAPAPPTNTPPVYDFDGTYIGDVLVRQVLNDGTAGEQLYENQEIVVDQIQDAVHIMGSVALATTNGNIIFNSQRTARNPGGPGQSTNAYTLTFLGTLNQDGGTVVVTTDIIADGIRVDGFVTTFTFGPMTASWN